MVLGLSSDIALIHLHPLQHHRNHPSSSQHSLPILLYAEVFSSYSAAQQMKYKPFILLGKHLCALSHAPTFSPASSQMLPATLPNSAPTSSLSVHTCSSCTIHGDVFPPPCFPTHENPPHPSRSLQHHLLLTRPMAIIGPPSKPVCQASVPLLQYAQAILTHTCWVLWETPLSQLSVPWGVDWILFSFESVYIAINKVQEMKSINSVQNCASFFTEGSLVIETLEPLIVSFHILNFGKAIKTGKENLNQNYLKQ